MTLHVRHTHFATGTPNSTTHLVPARVLARLPRHMALNRPEAAWYRRFLPIVGTILCLALLATSCSTTRRLTDGDVLYTGVKKMTFTPANDTLSIPDEVVSAVQEPLSVAPNNPLWAPYWRTGVPIGLWAWNYLYSPKEKGFKYWFYKKLAKQPILISKVRPDLRLKVAEYFGGDTDRITSFFERIFGGRPLQADLNNVAAVENEIRSKLLKAGGPAFVAEDPKAFLPMEDVRRIILAAGGIPTYPFLADDAKGGFTDFEQDVKKTAQILKERRIYSVEFITTRNSIEVLEAYAGYLHEQGFVVTFGSEHNTPAMEPILLSARGGRPLTPKLKAINYAGACVIAAHQEALNRGFEGYTSHEGMPSLAKRNLFIQEGNRLIRSLIR